MEWSEGVKCWTDGETHRVSGKTEELKEGFSDTVTSPTRITFAFYNGLWAYGGW